MYVEEKGSNLRSTVVFAFVVVGLVVEDCLYSLGA